MTVHLYTYKIFIIIYTIIFLLHFSFCFHLSLLFGFHRNVFLLFSSCHCLLILTKKILCFFFYFFLYECLAHMSVLKYVTKIGIIDCCNLPCGHCKLNLGPLQKLEKWPKCLSGARQILIESQTLDCVLFT